MILEQFSLYRKTVFYRVIIAVFDQGFISIINFCVQILLIKLVTKDEFGYYSLGLSIIMYLMSFQNAVVNTPITVTLAERNTEDKNKYVSAIFTGQFYLLLFICTIGTILSLLIESLGFYNDYNLLAMSLFIGSFGVLNREFLRSYFFAEERPEKVLKLDIYYGLIYLALIGLAFLVYKVNVPLVIMFMGIASAFDSLILNKEFRYKKSKIREIIHHYKGNWQISKWSLIGITVTHIQNFTYLYVIGLMLGSAAMGEVSASRLLLMPLGLIINGWGNVIRPYGSQLREENLLNKFYKHLVLASAGFQLLIIIFTIILLIFSDTILKLGFNENYNNIFEYLPLWALLSGVSFIRANASYGLQVVKKFKSLALVNLGTMITTILFAIVLTMYWEIKGALIASLIGSIVFSVILWIMLHKSVFSKNYE